MASLSGGVCGKELAPLILYIGTILWILKDNLGQKSLYQEIQVKLNTLSVKLHFLSLCHHCQGGGRPSQEGIAGNTQIHARDVYASVYKDVGSYEESS